MDKINQQLKKGLLEILVLKLLSNKDMYGYELILQLRELSQGVFDLKEGTLYPLLYRLEDNCYIECYWRHDDNKRSAPRKYYSVTAKGKQYLQSSQEQWEITVKTVNTILNYHD